MIARGSNLAVDVVFYDRYDNIISTELSDTFFNEVRAQFQYLSRS